MTFDYRCNAARQFWTIVNEPGDAPEAAQMLVDARGVDFRTNSRRVC